MIDLQVSIVTYNNAGTIADCLESVLSECAVVEAETKVTVVDNSPGGETAEVVARFAGVTLVRSGENLGFGRGHNRVLRAWEAGRYLILNPDAVLLPGALGILMKALETDPGTALVGPRVEYEAEWPQLSFGPFPGLFADLRQRAFTRGVQRQDPYAVARLEKMLSTRLYPDWISGSCFLARGEDLRSVDGFEDMFFLYLEDVDLCKRLRARGRRVMVEPAAVCRHIEGHSFDDAAGARPHYRRSRLIYENRHGSRSGFWLYRLLRGRDISDVRFQSGKRWQS